MIGAGIFVLPGPAAAMAGPAVVIAFLVGGLIALLTAMSVAELGTAMPKAGGSYFFVNHALGPLFGSIAGWGNWLGLAFASAFYAIGFGRYASLFLPVGDLELWHLTLSEAQLGALGAGALFIFVNYIGAKETGRLQNIIVITLIAILVFFSIGGVLVADPANLQPFAPKGWDAVLPTTALVFVSFLGFAKISTVAEEIRNPGRNLPLAVIGSVVIVTFLYVVVLLVITSILPIEELGASGDIAVVEVARVALGGVGVTLITFGGLLATASSANASILASSRINFAMGRDRLVSSWLNAIHRRFRTPHRSIIVTGVLIIAAISVGDIKTLAKAGSVLHLLVYGLINLSVLVMRQSKSPDYKPSYRLPFYPFTPILGAVCSFGLILFMAPMEIGMSALLVAFAVLWYVFYARHKTVASGVLSRLILRRADDLPTTAVKAASFVKPDSTSFRVMVPLANPLHEENLIRLAAAAARSEGGTVVAVHIIGIPDQTPLSAGAEALTDLRRESERLLQNAEEHAAELGVDVETHTVVSHRVFESIFSSARNLSADLVVIGYGEDSHGSPGRVESAFDELTEELPCDFIVFKDRGFDPTRILIPTLGGPDTSVGAALGRALRTEHDSEITLLTVVSSDEEREAARVSLEELRDEYSLPTAIVEVAVDEDIRAAIERYAEQHTLLILGASGQGLLRRLARGAIGTRIVEDVDTSVIIGERARSRSLLERLFG